MHATRQFYHMKFYLRCSLTNSKQKPTHIQAYKEGQSDWHVPYMKKWCKSMCDVLNLRIFHEKGMLKNSWNSAIFSNVVLMGKCGSDFFSRHLEKLLQFRLSYRICGINTGFGTSMSTLWPFLVQIMLKLLQFRLSFIEIRSISNIIDWENENTSKVRYE